jgi:hypothetical protein
MLRTGSTAPGAIGQRWLNMMYRHQTVISWRFHARTVLLGQWSLAKADSEALDGMQRFAPDAVILGPKRETLPATHPRTRRACQC